MANPLQGVTQLGINQFYGLLQTLEGNAKQVIGDLNADKAELTHLYAMARADANTTRGTANMRALDPLVHNNSALRLRYQDLVAKFNGAVNAAGAQIRAAGFTAPTLSGLGIFGADDAVIIGVAIAALGAAFLIYESVRAATDAQRTATRAMAQIIADPNASASDRQTALDALKKTPSSNPFDLSGVYPILGVVALIMLGPELLRMFKSRKAA